MLRTILVPLDGSQLSEQVLPLVAGIASALGSEVHLLHVVEMGPPPFKWEGEFHPDWFQAAGERKALAQMGPSVALLERAGVRAHTRTSTGAAADGILQAAAAVGADLIAMTTHGRSGLARWVLGSVADKMIRAARLPVLLYHPRAGSRDQTAVPGLKVVLLPLDGSAEAEAAAPYAAALARDLKLSLVVLRVVREYRYAMSAIPQVYPELHQQLLVEATEYTQAQAMRLSATGARASSRILTGDPAESIEALARDLPGALVVMATHGREGFERSFLGSVTDRIARSGACPVLVVPLGEPAGAQRSSSPVAAADN